MLLTDVGKHLLVVPARVFLLSFSKWYVVGDAAISSVSLRILLSHVERDTNRERCNTARPIKLNVPGANVLLGFLNGVVRIPGRIRCNTKRSSESQSQSAKDFHLA
jgi:hypothetical protein